MCRYRNRGYTRVPNNSLEEGGMKYGSNAATSGKRVALIHFYTDIFLHSKKLYCNLYLVFCYICILFYHTFS